jgi:hypothetical protein
LGLGPALPTGRAARRGCTGPGRPSTVGLSESNSKRSGAPAGRLGRPGRAAFDSESGELGGPVPVIGQVLKFFPPHKVPSRPSSLSVRSLRFRVGAARHQAARAEWPRQAAVAGSCQ